MIVLPKDDLLDQEGMERAMRWYFAHAEEDPESRGTFNTLLGVRFEMCDYERRTAVFSLGVQHWMANPLRMLHGGITASVLDMAMGLLCRYFSGGYMTPTVSMSVDYLRPGPVNGRIHVGAEVTMRGFTICHAVGRLWAEGAPDRLLATSTGSYCVTRPKTANTEAP